MFYVCRDVTNKIFCFSGKIRNILVIFYIFLLINKYTNIDVYSPKTNYKTHHRGFFSSFFPLNGGLLCGDQLVKLQYIQRETVL